MLLCLLLTFTLMINHSLKQFIILLTSPAQKRNYLPLDMVLIKLRASIIFPRSLLSLILFTWSKEFSTLLFIPSKFSQLLFCLTFAISSTVTPTTLSNFGNAWAISSGIFIMRSIMRSIKKLKYSNHYFSTHAKIYETSARNAKVMTFWTSGKWCSKLQISKGINFMDLVDNDNTIIKSTYIKEES